MKKKLLLTALMVLMFIVVFAVTVFADVQDPTCKVWFSLDSANKTAAATTANAKQDFSNEDGSLGEVVIPSEITVGDVTYTVTTIKQHAFSGANGNWGQNSTFKKVTIPSSVNSIEEHAFRQAPNLETIIINSTDTNIPNGFCYNCPSLKHIDMSGSTITTIDNNSFYGTQCVESLIFPSTLKSIGVAFQNSMKSANGPEVTLEFPASLESISGKQAFNNCSRLKRVIFNEHPSGEATLVIGNNIFQSSGVREIVFPKTLKSIGEHTLNSCASLRFVLMPANATYHKDMFKSTGTVKLTFFQGSEDAAKALYKTFTGGGYGNNATQFVDFSSYNPNTDYYSNSYCTVFYNTPSATCQKCNGLLGDTEYVFVDPTTNIQEQKLCTHCGEGDVTKHAPIFKDLGYSFSLYSNSVLHNVAICHKSLQLYNEKFPDEQISAYGILTVLKSNVDETGVAFTDNGTAKDKVKHVDFSTKTVSYDIITMKVNGLNPELTTDQGVSYGDLEIYICGFIKVGDKTYYINDTSSEKLFGEITYNSLVEADK